LIFGLWMEAFLPEMGKKIMGWFKDLIDTIIGWFTGGVPSIDKHKASFLMDNAATRMMNILSPNLPRDSFKAQVDRCKANGDNFLYLYLMDEKDGGWTPFSFYVGNKIGTVVDKDKLSEMIWRAEYARKKKLGIVFWLRADDSPNFNKTPVDLQKKYQKDAVESFDKYASAYIVGLEADEYMNAATAEMYAAHLKGLTKRHIGVHQTTGKCDFALQPSIGSIWYQFGFGKSAGQIQSETALVKVKMCGKPVFAAEYHKSSDSAEAKALGDAAMRGGASGTGNGRN